MLSLVLNVSIPLNILPAKSLKIRISFLGLLQIPYNFPQFPPTDVQE